MKTLSGLKSLKKILNVVINVLSILCGIVLLPFLLINLVLITKTIVHADTIPDFMGITPLIVESGSMEPVILTGDLIFVKKTDFSSLHAGEETGSIIAYRSGSSVVTHRIIAMDQDDEGELCLIMQGDANNTTDQDPVWEDQIIGEYFFRLPKMGDAASFLQTPAGIVFCIGGPFLFFAVAGFFQRRKQSRAEADERERLERELEDLLKRTAATEEDEQNRI